MHLGRQPDAAEVARDELRARDGVAWTQAVETLSLAMFSCISMYMKNHSYSWDII